MRAVRSVLVLLSLAVATAADAGLTPTKGSQLVTLAAGGTCPIPGRPNAVAFGFRIGGDGTTTAFTVPPKQVLVLNDVITSTNFQVPGDVFLVSVLVGNATQSNFAVAKFETAPTSGAFSVSFTATPGIVVKSGATACIELIDSNFPGTFVGALSFAHGYLAPDK